MAAEIEFFFDCSSPWSYLAFHNIRPLAASIKAQIHWRPFLVGGVFNAVNPTVYASRSQVVPAKEAHGKKSLDDWARWSGIAFRRFPPSVFPVNSVKVMRACLILDRDGLLPAFAQAAFEAYFRDDLDISQDASLRKICQVASTTSGVPIDAHEMLLATSDPAVKEQLRANGDELISRGGYGSPTIFVGGDDMYFGNDNLPLVQTAVLRLRKTNNQEGS